MKEAGEWREANRGTALKETPRGLTYLEFSPWRITALRPSPSAAWVKLQERPSWRGASLPDISLGRLIRQIRAERSLERGVSAKELAPDERPPQLPYERRRRRNFARFLEQVPAEIEAELAERYPARDWRLYRLLRTSPHAQEACARGDRALVFALTEARLFFERPPRNYLAFVARWLRRPWRKALARIRFPDRPLSVTVLRKLLPAHADGEIVWLLRAALRDDESAKALAHVSRVNAAVALLVQPRCLERVTPALLESQALVTDRWEAVAAQRMLYDAMQLERQLGARSRPRFSTLESLRAYHDELVEAARRDKLASSDVPFPPPPAQLTAQERSWIAPLVDGGALVHEGARMQHCLGTLDEHHWLAERGLFYAWALFGAERATVAIVCHDETWRLYDARGVANAPPGDQVTQWARAIVRRANAAARTTTTTEQLELLLDAAPF